MMLPSAVQMLVSAEDSCMLNATVSMLSSCLKLNDLCAGTSTIDAFTYDSHVWPSSDVSKVFYVLDILTFYACSPALVKVKHLTVGRVLFIIHCLMPAGGSPRNVVVMI